MQPHRGASPRTLDERSTGPLISVIVVAYNRRQYVGDAVASVVAQDINASDFEIIVVKNFTDSAIDTYLAQVGAKSILCENMPYSISVATGFEAARGQVIAILDDDDLFEPSRLSSVLQAFRTHPGLGFYRNGFTYIDGEGHPLSQESFHGLTSRLSVPRDSLLLSPMNYPQTYRKLAHRHADFNPSSMAVRRDVVDYVMPYLLRMWGFVDTLLFFGALTSGFSLFFDSRRLTRYRVHSTNWSMLGAGSTQTRLHRLRENALRGEQNYRVIRELVVASGHASALRLIDAQILVNQVTLQIQEPNSQRRDFAQSLRRSLSYRDTYPVRDHNWIVVSSLFLLSPSIGRAVSRQVRIQSA